MPKVKLDGQLMEWGVDDLVDYLSQYGPVKVNYFYDHPDGGVESILLSLPQGYLRAFEWPPIADTIPPHWCFTIINNARITPVHFSYHVVKAVQSLLGETT